MTDKRKIELTVDCESCKIDIDQEKQASDSLGDCAQKAVATQQQSEGVSKTSREWVQGLLRGLEEYASKATNAAEHVEKAFEKAFKNIEDQLVRLITKGKFSLKQFLRDLAADTARAVIRIGVTGPIANKLGGALRGVLPGLKPPPNPTVDKLDDVNKTCIENLQAQKDTEAQVTKAVSECAKLLTELEKQTELLDRIADCSCGADTRLQELQQFQVGNEGDGFGDMLRAVLDTVVSGGTQQLRVGNEGGGFGDMVQAVLGKALSGVAQGRPGQEMLTLLESGATALAQGAGGAAQQVQVVVENRGATQQEAVEQRAAMDGGRLVVNVALDDITRRGPLSQALEQTYALGRRTG